MTYVEPVLSIVIVLILLGWRLQRHRLSGWKKWALPCAAALLFLASWAPVHVLLSRSLEAWYTPGERPPPDAEAIVVLSAGARRPVPSETGEVPDERTLIRCQHAVWLYRSWKQVPIVVSGGEVNRSEGIPVIAARVMKKLLVSQGVPDEMVMEEDESTSTYWNAVYSAAILREKGYRKIVLVTDAHHMLRSEKSFRRQGLEVYPSPCRFVGTRFPTKISEYFPHAAALRSNESVLHEWAGLVWYWISDKI